MSGLKKSSFQGKIKEIPGIAIDNFTDLKCRAYFLSHCHTDHMEGLHSLDFIRSIVHNNVLIYMSKITADIVAKDLVDIDKYIKKLDIGEEDITLPKMFGYEEQYINVTLIPAGHCFGSVMFLIRTNKSTVLYTGDFRIKENDVSKIGLIHDKYNQPISINTMYVDTTFISNKYSSFPQRNICVEHLIEIIKEWFNMDENHAVALNTSARIGYEFLFNEVFKRLNHKVYVDKERYKFYKNNLNQVPGVSNEEIHTRLHVCNREHSNHKLCIPNSEKYANFLFVRLSAIKWSDYDLEQSPIVRISEKRVNVCFPTHCSRSELIYFVNYLSPKEVIGFPNKYDVHTENVLLSDYPLQIKCTPTKRKCNTINDNSISQSINSKVPAHILKDIFQM